MITLWKLLVRNILKHKTYSAINVLGLAFGFTAFILVNLFVRYELSWDEHNKNYDRIDRIQRIFENINYSSNGNNISPHSRGITAKLLEGNFPEFENITSVKPYENKYISPDREKLFTDKWPICADNNFFDVFTYFFTEGDPETALHEPMSRSETCFRTSNKKSNTKSLSSILFPFCTSVPMTRMITGLFSICLK